MQRIPDQSSKLVHTIISDGEIACNTVILRPSIERKLAARGLLLILSIDKDIPLLIGIDFSKGPLQRRRRAGNALGSTLECPQYLRSRICFTLFRGQEPQPPRHHRSRVS
ncbi:hypothetical protein CISG_05349 [Coccidioides immitis RMSCC 3703]|uniref:Uncharacterized protein n=1 Tax=Coccidioides immitis RMSCC 3703 TaxID=454286 RepID=A0A0J8QUH2_COCIT|nr:hypothetical protein CISG_05349 [Coccidioides immitis RMSCC 3703]